MNSVGLVVKQVVVSNLKTDNYCLSNMSSAVCSSTGAVGLYLHIPFCSAICDYCNFNRGLYDETLKQRYVNAIKNEIERWDDSRSVDSIFFGGGTPSLLAANDVSEILAACRSAFDIASDVETTLEMNPESCTQSDVEAFLAAGITRVSLGVQSFLDSELKRLGRAHTVDEAKEAVAAIRSAGCNNLSIDLMLWLPGQTRADCLKSVNEMVRCGPDHASLYMLEIYPNSPLRDEMARSDWSVAPEDDASDMYFDALSVTDSAGYQQYEISNVARPARHSRHNLKYWRYQNWIGFGCGAHSMLDGCRWKNISGITDYIDTIEQRGTAAEGRQRLSAEELLGEAIFMGLRLNEGIDVHTFGEQYGVNLRTRFGHDLGPYMDQGVLIDEGGRWRLSRKGMLLSNEVMRTFV